MTRDDINRMSRETGICRLIRPQRHEDMEDMLEHFAAFVAAAEREACAKVCEFQMPNPVQNWADAQIVNALRDCAEAIRARNT